MAFPCPRCGDQYTQSLPMAFEAGVGSNPRGWRSNRGSCGMPISEGQIASRAKPPVRRSVAQSVLMLVVVWLFLGFPIVSVLTTALRSAASPMRPAVTGGAPPNRGNQTPSADSPPDSLPPAQPISLARTLVSFAPPVLVLLGLSAYLVWRAIHARRFNRTAYPRLLADWQSSLICKVCGAVFRSPEAEADVPRHETSGKGLP
jgi:hypothetical protein